MRRLMLLCFISQVYPAMQTVKRSMYVSRKSRSYSVPVETEYKYSDYSYHPGVYTSITSNDHQTSHGTPKDSMDYIPSIQSYDNFNTLAKPYSEYVSETTYTTSAPPMRSITEHYEEPTTKYDIDYERQKSEARYNSRFLPSKIKSDLMYERLKSLMHYKPYSDHNINEIEFDMSKEYHSDDDNDIRTTSRSYDTFPYFYHGVYGPYDFDSEVDNENDKKNSFENYANVIPVHENISDDIPPNNFQYDKTILPRHTGTTEKSPVSGDNAFFSYVLNDYYNKANDEDPLEFKGIGEWGNDVHYDSAFYDNDHNIKRPIRHKKNNYRFHTTPSYITNSKGAIGEAVTESAHETNSEFEKGLKSNEAKARDKIGYENHKSGYQGLKDIADAVAHKFGSENHNKESKFEIKHNQDKGENRKGFHRVYHKDEYMEDKEFFDNSNSSARGKDQGSSSVRNGGSEVVLKSLAKAKIDDESNAVRNVGDRENKHSESSHKGHSSTKDTDSEFNKHRKVAKTAAQRNADDYVNDDLELLYGNHDIVLL